MQAYCTKKADFKPIAETLDKLHHKGYVHSDIWMENLLFPKEDAKIIDFDLVNKNGGQYPDEYNSSVHDCHKEAKKGSPRHDCYSFIYILQRKTQVEDDTLQQKLLTLKHPFLLMHCNTICIDSNSSFPP